MNETRRKQVLSLVICIVLIAAMAFLTNGCKDNKEAPETPVEQVTPIEDSTDENPNGADVTPTEGEDSRHLLGEGSTTFTFIVRDVSGDPVEYQIKTDKKMVGAALEELGLIAGEEGLYGLYVKVVDGITYDYDKDGKYWAFYINGEMAAVGVDSTEVVAGETYEFRAE